MTSSPVDIKFIPSRPGRSSISLRRDETSPLLPSHPVGEEDDCHELDTTFWGSFKLLSTSAAPLTVGFLLEACFPLVSTLIAGRLGPIELATVGQGIQLVGVTTTVLILSSTAAQTTLSAPLFTSKSASAKKEIGIMAQRGFILAHICVIPMAFVWWFIKPIMIALGQPESLANGLQSFLRWNLLSIPGYVLMETSKSFLQAQSIFHPSTIIVALILPLHTALTYFLVHRTNLRQDGVAISLAGSYALIGSILVLWISRSEARECWGGWNKRCLDGWRQFLGILIPSAMMYGSEWWSFELVSLLAGRLGEASIAAQAAITSMDLYLAMIPYAVSLASTVRLGQLLGHNTPTAVQAATVTVRAGYVFAISVTACLATGLLLGRHWLARLYVAGDDMESEEVRGLIASVLIPIALYQISDALASIGSSILRSTARQNLQAVMIVGSYYVLGLPLGYYLAYKKNWGLVGLWSGTSVGLFWVGAFGVIFYFSFIDWKVEMKRAMWRSRESTLGVVVEEEEASESDSEAETTSYGDVRI